MKKTITTFAAVMQSPVFPKTAHQFRPVSKTSASPKPAQRENTFSKSRDVREDRGTRKMKASHNDRTNHAL